MTRLARSKRTSVRLAQRAQILLLAAQGLQNKGIAEQLGIGRVQVARWRERFLESGLQGIERDRPRGAPPVKVDVSRLVELTIQSKPEAATHWSTRKMAAVLDVSPSTVMPVLGTLGAGANLVSGGWRASAGSWLGGKTYDFTHPDPDMKNIGQGYNTDGEFDPLKVGVFGYGA